MPEDIANSLTQDLEPAALVIFGITGDLAKRKVLPALYHLFQDNLLPEHFEIIGTSRRELLTDDIVKEVEQSVTEEDDGCDPEALATFRERLTLIQIDPVKGEDYDRLHQLLDQIEDKHGVCMNRLYYLSIPPQVYGPVVRELGERGLNTSCRHGKAATRLLVEKPFGYDQTSGKALIEETSHVFSEAQVFRIDHYLAKETAQNILTFRRFNPLFDDIWDNEHIRSIQIEAAEKIGIEGRADFYEQVGALRDLVQSHLMQLLALTTMELPLNLADSDAIHTAKQALLEAIPAVPYDRVTDEVVRAQYEGYRDEVNNPDSTTETFVSVKLTIDNDRWRGVPITLQTGKSLDAKRTEITVCFGKKVDDDSSNQLTFRIQPNEGIDVRLLVKKPGFAQTLQHAHMNFSYQETFNDHDHPDAYERVLIDAIRGDHALFATSEEVMASWRILQPILDQWQRDSSDLKTYPVGSRGPNFN